MKRKRYSVEQIVLVVGYHLMRTDGKRWLGKMELPQVTMEMPLAWGGDYVQQLAVAGSDALPLTPSPIHQQSPVGNARTMGWI